MDVRLDWLVPGQLLLTSRPGYPDEPYDEGYGERYRRHLTGVVATGVRVLWSFLDDQDLARYGLVGLEADLAAHGVVLRRCPIHDFGEPTLEQADAFVSQLDRDLAGGPVALSCSAGKGRTGTMAACYLVSQGQTARAAIIEVRRVRPGTIETQGQAELVAEFARTRGIGRGTTPASGRAPVVGGAGVVQDAGAATLPEPTGESAAGGAASPGGGRTAPTESAPTNGRSNGKAPPGGRRHSDSCGG